VLNSLKSAYMSGNLPVGAGTVVPLDSRSTWNGIELLSIEGGEEFVLDHVGSRGEVGGEVERVQRVLGQEGEGPGRGGRVIVFLDDLRRIRKIQLERGSRLGNSAD
jgi:hypothetical protein